MKFELEESLRGVPDNEVLEDLRRCAKLLGKDTITILQYEEFGKAHPSMLQRRFGSWSKALKFAGLQPSRSKIGSTNDELFQNIRNLWTILGRQPRYSETKAPFSRFSADTYGNRFGSWSNALREFVAWANSDVGDELR